MPTSSAAASASPRALPGAAELPAAINGERVSSGELVVDASDPGFLRGDGAFEVIRLYDGVALATEEHLERLRRSARDLALQYDADALAEECAQICRQLPPADGYLRIAVTRLGTRFLMAEPPLRFPPV